MWKDAFKNTSIVLAGVLLSRFFVFLYNTLIIRQLSVADYARFAFAVAVFNWVLIFAHLDLYAAVSRFVSRNRSLNRSAEAWQYYRQAGLLAAFFSVAGIVVALLIAGLREYPLGALILFMLSLLPTALMTVNDGYLKGMEKFGLAAWVDISSGLFKFAVIGTALLLMDSLALTDVLSLFLLASLLVYAVSTVCVNRVRGAINPRPLKFRVQTAKSLINYSGWICLTDLMTSGILLSGNLILSYQAPAELALFNVVILVYSLFQMGFGAITTVLIPQVSRRRARNEKVRMLGYRGLGYVMLATALLICGLLTFPWRREVLLFLFDKPEYTEAMHYIAILLIAFPFRLLTMTNKGIVQGIGQPRHVFRATGGAFVTHILLFVPGYHLFGLSGAVGAMVCAYLVEFVLIRQAATRTLARQSAGRRVAVEHV